MVESLLHKNYTNLVYSLSMLDPLYLKCCFEKHFKAIMKEKLKENQQVHSIADLAFLLKEAAKFFVVRGRGGSTGSKGHYSVWKILMTLVYRLYLAIIKASACFF